jgi:SAM-dependent methyltransferase
MEYAKDSLMFVQVPLWQESWLGIRFNQLPVAINADSLPSPEFYVAFYHKLNCSYSCYSDFPVAWRTLKRASAEALASHIPHRAEVLSYGCGTGFVESTLIDLRSDIKITGFDFVSDIFHWIPSYPSRFTYTNVLNDGSKYDVIYFNQVLYSLPHQELLRVFESLTKVLKSHGTLIIIHHSAKPDERGASLSTKLRLWCKHFLYGNTFIRKCLFPNVQFWGWERTNGFYIRLALQFGIRLDMHYASAEQSVLVFRYDN